MSEPQTDVTTRDEIPANVCQTLGGDGAVLARFDRPRSAAPRTMAVVSDPHVSVTGAGTWKMFHRTRRRFLDALEEIETLDVDCLALAGDLTRDGAPGDLNWVKGALGSSCVPALVVPGNHDLTEIETEEFADRFTDGGYPAARRVGSVDLVGLNTVVAPGDDGGDTPERTVSEDQLAWLDAHLREADDPIVVTHHNLPGAEDTVVDNGWDPHAPIENSGELVDLLDRYGATLHVSGHLHFPAHTRERGVNALVAPALSSFPQVYLLVEIDATGTTVRCRTPADRDGIAEAYGAARDGSTRSRTVADVNAALLADLPLVDRGTDDAETTPPSGRSNRTDRDRSTTE